MMKYREIGKSGISASAIVLGAWAIGGGEWWGETDDEESIRTIRTAMDTGINMIDTAPIYGLGRSEEVVGKALEGLRDKMLIATKCGLWWNDETGSPHIIVDGQSVRRSLSADTLSKEIEISLRRLKTDRIDLYQTHWQSIPPYFTPISETMECLLNMKQQGKIRAIGVSNCSPEQMDEYLAVGRIDSNQPRYNMLNRVIEADIIPYCRRHDISILAYSPLEQGLLTGNIGLDRVYGEKQLRSKRPWFKHENRRRVLEMLNGWNDLCEKYECSTAQLVLSWTIHQPGITFAICGARKPDQVLENAASADINIQPEDVERMRRDIEFYADKPAV